MPRKPAFTALRIVNVNMNGLCSKLSILSDFLLEKDVKIACITETHLLPSTPNSFADIPHYSLIRHDTGGSFPKHGVCVFVHDSILIDSVSTPVPNVLCFRLAAYNVHIAVVYRPPSNSSSSNDELSSFISEFCIDKEIVVVGDFNLPSIDWSPSITVPYPSTQDKAFLDAFDLLGLTQWVTEPTYPRSGNILDIVLTSEPDRVGDIDILAPLPGCDHCPVLFQYVFETSGPNSDSSSSADVHRAWHKGKYTQISQCLRDVNWDDEFASRNVSSCVERLTDIVTGLTQQYVPLRQSKDRKTPWQSRPPTSLIRQRQLAWQRYKSVRQQLGRSSSVASDAFANFNQVNRQYRTFGVRAQADYESNLLVKAKENPKVLHSYIRNKKVGRPSVGPLKLESGELTDDPAVMCERFAESFASVYTRISPPDPARHQRHEGQIDDVAITTEMVKSVLENLDGNSAMGPDGLHPTLLKTCAAELAYPLSVIFCRSLSEGVVPQSWKVSTVIPIFKKGTRYDPLNYRPVSLTSVCCKSLERIIVQHLNVFLEDNSLLDSNQFGFRAGRSTMDQLLLVYSDVSRRVDEGGVMDVILFDYSKAFDVVCHDILLAKLHHLGIQGRVLDWISSFLFDRSMKVAVKRSLSQPRDVCSGVPQGSVLGPLLFLIYINHVASNLSCRYKIFADDLKMYACVHHRTSPSQSQSIVNVQSDIDALHATSRSWGLHMNPNKCAVLRFSRNHTDLTAPLYTMNGSVIPSVQSHLDLGVLVDSGMKFHGHIRSVVNKAGGLAQNLLKSTVCRSPDFMLFLLTTHIRPIIEYCSCLWNTGYQGDIRLLESVQRRWTKQIATVDGLEYGDRLRSLDLFSVKGRLLRADLIQYWKIFNDKSCITAADMFTLAPPRGTRGHCFKIFVPPTCTDLRKRFFDVRCISVWNSLPQQVVTATSLVCFKKLLKESLGDALFEYVR